MMYLLYIDIEVMESIHRPINVRHSVIKTANLGLKHKPTTVATSNTATPTDGEATTAGGSDTVTMDTTVEGMSNEPVTMETGDKTAATGCQGNIKSTDSADLKYAGLVTITTAQPATNITGHTGYLTFATLPIRH